MDKEWANLRSQKVWDETVVREWDEVAAEAVREGKERHFGWLFGICVEKNSELPEGDPLRKMKGRVVFQGEPGHQPELGSGNIPGPRFLPGHDGGVKSGRHVGMLPEPQHDAG